MKTERIHLLLVAAVLGCPADEGDATEEPSTGAASTDAASTGEEP